MDTYCVGRKQYDTDLIKNICSEYVAGISTFALAARHRMAAKTLRKIFAKEGIENRGVGAGIRASEAHTKANISRRKLDPEKRAAFCSAYLNDTSIKIEEHAAQFGISEGVARKILRDQEKIYREPAYRSYTVDEAFFNEINSPEKAYWLGFLFADGCVFEGSSTGIYIGLKGSDISHLELFKEAIKSNHPIKTRVRSLIHKNQVRDYPICILSIRNNAIVKALKNYGCVPNKTYQPEPVTGVPKELFRHFLRGCFDGDGCIVFSTRKNRNTRSGLPSIDPSWSCVGSKETMDYMYENLVEVVHFPISPLKQYRGCTHLRICGRHKVHFLFDFLYGEGGPCLTRKKNKWEAGASQLC